MPELHIEFDERRSLRDGLQRKKKVYEALMLRFIITRYGRENLGFLWVIVEPMLLCVGVMVIWSLTKGSSEHGLMITAVVYSGYMALTLWRHMTNSMIFVLKSGKFLTNYKNVSQLDVVLSRIFLEFISVTAAAIIVYAALHSVGLMPDIYSIELLMIGWLTMGALGFGGGMLLVGATEISEVTEKFIQPIQYLMIPVSGCFFFLSWLPDKVREQASYVPFVHAYETIRAGIFGPEVSTYGEPWYALCWALAAAGIGIGLIGLARDRIQPH